MSIYEGRVEPSKHKERVMVKRNQPWNPSEHPVSFFNHVKKAIKQLIKAEINPDKNIWNDCALITFNKCSDFNKVINNWDKKPMRDQRWDELKKFMPTEYSKMKLKADEWSIKAAGYGTAVNLAEAKSLLEDYSTATNELIAKVTNASTKNDKTMMAANNKLLKQLIAKLTATFSRTTHTMTLLPAPLQA